MKTVLSHPPIEFFRPCGSLNASNAAELKSELMAAVSDNPHSILLLDMAQVESLDSAGLMVLVSALSLAQRLKRKFYLCSLSPAVRIIFELTQLEHIFKIFEDYAAVEVLLTT